MGRRAADRRPGLSRAAAMGAAFAVLVASGCGDGTARSEASDGRPVEQSLFAVGSEAAWGLLGVPRSGGAARLASLTGSADSTAWRGSVELPPSMRAHPLGERHLALLTPDGRVVRYDPVRDLTSSVGRLTPGAEWVGHDRWGVFRDTASGSLLQVAPGGAWRYDPSPGAAWASPARDGSVVAVVPGRDGEPGALLHYERGGDESTGRLSGVFAPAGVVTGFGAQAAVARETRDGWELLLVELPSLEPASRTGLPGRPDALAASPSGHELYVAAGDRILVLGRPSLALRAERRLPAPVLELRPGMLGGPLLARTEGGVHLLPWSEDGSVPVETRWRPDLPLTLPDGSILVVRGDRVLRIRGGREGGEASAASGSAARWWVPVRWNPPSPASSPSLAAEAGPEAGAQGRRVSAPAPADDSAAADSAVAAEDSSAAERPPAPEPGFYAVVAAARGADGIRRLLDDLSGDGWPTALQEWKDDAGDVWYRGLVGPYDTRPEAEEAARSLQRERDVSVWVKELGPGISGQP